LIDLCLQVRWWKGKIRVGGKKRSSGRIYDTRAWGRRERRSAMDSEGLKTKKRRSRGQDRVFSIVMSASFLYGRSHQAKMERSLSYCKKLDRAVGRWNTRVPTGGGATKIYPLRFRTNDRETKGTRKIYRKQFRR